MCQDLEVSYLIQCKMSSVQNRDGTRRREQVSDFSCETPTTQPPCYGTETESCAMLFQCVHSYYMRVYDVLSDACPECYRRAFMKSGKLAKFKERLAGLATKFDDRPRCYEGCTTDTVDYLQNLHDTFAEESAASKFPFNHLNPLDFMLER